MSRVKFAVLLTTAFGLAAAWRSSAGEPPTRRGEVSGGYAALAARLRFGTGPDGSSAISSVNFEKSSRVEDAAERDFQQAMAALIAVTVEHPGSEVADRARCVLDAAAAALDRRDEETKKARDFEKCVAIGVTASR